VKIIDTGKTLTEKDITMFEKDIQCQIPDDYRLFLLSSNGGYPELCDFQVSDGSNSEAQITAVEYFLGIDVHEKASIKYYIDTHKDRIPKWAFPIACDPGGSLICISTARNDAGKIYFWDREEECEEGETPTDENFYFIADNLQTFLDCLS
jgi:hypothetical protein